MIRTTRKSARRILATLALALAVPAPVMVAPAASAATAVSCTPPAVSNHEGYAYMNTTANLKVAPYAECGTVTSVSSGTKVWLQCTEFNDYGNWWWYVRIAGTSTYGWMVDGKLDVVPYDDNGDGYLDFPHAC